MYTKLDFSNCARYNDHKVWFVPHSSQVFRIFINHQYIGDLIDSDMGCSILNKSDNVSIDEINDRFKEYKSRPEYYVSKQHEVDSNQEANVTQYETLFIGCGLIRAYLGNSNPDDYIDSLQSRLDWLRSTDFYNAPASTIYHDAEIGGLLSHTLRVVYNIQNLSILDKFKGSAIHRAVLVALCHDWCKIGLYSTYKRNVKNDLGQWEQVDAFKRNDSTIPLGHGVESLYKAMKVFKLNDEECLSIRWHMGRWNVADNEVNEFQHANERYPLVHMLQFADQLAITSY